MIKVSNEAGFTLIELVITMAIVAIVAMMAAPQMIQIVRQNQLNDDARDFFNTLVELRADAVLTQKEKTIVIASEPEDPDSSATPSEPEDVVLDWAPNKHTKWNGGVAPVTTLTYTMMGRLRSDQNLCFVLEHAKDTSKKAVIIARITGNVIYDKRATTCPSNIGDD